MGHMGSVVAATELRGRIRDKARVSECGLELREEPPREVYIDVFLQTPYVLVGKQSGIVKNAWKKCMTV